MYFCTLCFAFASVLDRTKNFLAAERRRVGYREETIRFGDFVGGRPTLFREFSVVNGGSKSEKGRRMGGSGKNSVSQRVLSHEFHESVLEQTLGTTTRIF